MNRNDDIGSPCLRPLEDQKLEEGAPFTKIEKKEVEIIEWIQLNHSSANLNYFMTKRRYTQLRLLYAFKISNFNSIPYFLCRCSEWIV